MSYVLDTIYPDTFFQELSPAWLSYVRAMSGVAARSLDESFTYLELGAGLAHSTVVNAAACPRGEFHACDFNASHVEGGRRFANALGLRNIEFHETAFEALLTKDLPAFDFIVLHGVYSWVGPEARAAIRDIIREKLAPGGVVYVSYNCMPGWASELPVRRLLVELASSAPGESGERMRHAIQTLRRMVDGGLRYFDNNDEAMRALLSYERGPASYLAHEFLNDSWEPFYSIDVSAEMAKAGVSFLGSATLADNHPMLVIDDSSAAAMKTLTTTPQQHLALDFATDRRFRRDVFIRSDTERSPNDAVRALQSAIIGSINDPRRLSRRVKVPRGHISFQPDFMEELKGLLGAGSITVGEALATLGRRTRNTAEIARNLAFMVAGGALSPFARVYRHTLPSEVNRPANPIVERTLAYIVEHRTPRALPSELLGNGVLVTPLEALAIIELLGGIDASELPIRLRSALVQLRLDTRKETGELRSQDEVTSYIEDTIRHVATTLLPNLARLQLVA